MMAETKAQVYSCHPWLTTGSYQSCLIDDAGTRMKEIALILEQEQDFVNRTLLMAEPQKEVHA